MTVDVDDHSEAVSPTDLHAGGSDVVLMASEPVPEAVRTRPGPAYVYRTRETGRLPPRHRLQTTARSPLPTRTTMDGSGTANLYRAFRSVSCYALQRCRRQRPFVSGPSGVPNLPARVA